MNYSNLIEDFGGISLEKQETLGSIIGDLNWSVDMTTGTLSFGDQFKYSIQVIGTYSLESETWLWAWANDKISISEDLLKDAKKLQQYGKENDLDFLVTADFDADMLNVHGLGVIASGVCDASAYYCGNFGQGIVLMTLKSEELDNMEFNEEARILTTFPNLINIFEVDHKRSLKAYLEKKGYQLSENGDQLTAAKKGKSLHASFDEKGRLTSLNGNIEK